MAKRAVGLDIGTCGIRAVEVTTSNSGYRLVQLAEAPLPAGAVIDGEVMDTALVTDAIRGLWKDAKLSRTQVALGVANQKVIVRQLDLPRLPLDELRATLGYHVAEVLPMPVDQALLDVHPLADVTDATGLPAIRALLVAADAAMVRASVTAARGAGLTVASVDLAPFALMRSLAAPQLLGRTDRAEVLIDAGASVTTVVVHAQGVPLFVRILGLGGQEITQRLAERVGTSMASAEQLKRSLGIPRQRGGADATTEVAVSAADEWVDEVRGSLDYYLAQTDARPLSRVRVAGGAVHLGGLAATLANVIGLPVELADPYAAVTVGNGVTTDDLRASAHHAAVGVGLALGVLEGNGA
jgi:type IV pilus assembly protein PilM